MCNLHSMPQFFTFRCTSAEVLVRAFGAWHSLSHLALCAGVPDTGRTPVRANSCEDCSTPAVGGRQRYTALCRGADIGGAVPFGGLLVNQQCSPRHCGSAGVRMAGARRMQAGVSEGAPSMCDVRACGCLCACWHRAPPNNHNHVPTSAEKAQQIGGTDRTD